MVLSLPGPATCCDDDSSSEGSVTPVHDVVYKFRGHYKPKQETIKQLRACGYQLENMRIGSGRYAIVDLATTKECYRRLCRAGHKCTPGKQVALKMFDKNKYEPYEKDLIDILGQHPNVLLHYETFESACHSVLATEYCKNGTMTNFVEENSGPCRGLPIQQAIFYFLQLLKAVDYLHDKNIVHRDIKVENLLLDDHYNLKLADFGYACLSEPNPDGRIMLKNGCGSLQFIAPEVIFNTTEGYDAKKADIYSCGCVLYYMIHGRPPYSSVLPNDREQAMNNQAFEIDKDLEQGLKAFLPLILNHDPDVRPSLEHMLNDSWMQKYLSSSCMKDPEPCGAAVYPERKSGTFLPQTDSMICNYTPSPEPDISRFRKRHPATVIVDRQNGTAVKLLSRVPNKNIDHALGIGPAPLKYAAEEHESHRRAKQRILMKAQKDALANQKLIPPCFGEPCSPPPEEVIICGRFRGCKVLHPPPKRPVEDKSIPSNLQNGQGCSRFPPIHGAKNGPSYSSSAQEEFEKQDNNCDKSLHQSLMVTSLNLQKDQKGQQLFGDRTRIATPDLLRFSESKSSQDLASPLLSCHDHRSPHPPSDMPSPVGSPLLQKRKSSGLKPQTPVHGRPARYVSAASRRTPKPPTPVRGICGYKLVGTKKLLASKILPKTPAPSLQPRCSSQGSMVKSSSVDSGLPKPTAKSETKTFSTTRQIRCNARIITQTRKPLPVTTMQFTMNGMCPVKTPKPRYIQWGGSGTSPEMATCILNRSCSSINLLAEIQRSIAARDIDIPMGMYSPTNTPPVSQNRGCLVSPVTMVSNANYVPDNFECTGDSPVRKSSSFTASSVSSCSLDSHLKCTSPASDCKSDLSSC